MMSGIPILAFAAAFCLAFASDWLLLIPWRKSAGAHWTERARRLRPASLAGTINAWIIPVDVFLTIWLLFRPDAGYLPIIGMASWLGAHTGNFPGTREIYGLTFRSWCHQVGGGWLLRLGAFIPLIGVGALMPYVFDWRVWTTALALFLYLSLLNWGLGLRLARGLRLLKPADERLRRIVAETSRQMEVTPPRTWILSSVLSYAAAIITTRELIFSDRLLALHPDEEVAAICAHELGHLTESRAVFLSRVAGSFLLFPLIFLKPVVANYDYYGIIILFATILAGLFVLRRLGREMEVRADATALRHESDPGIYARALERLYWANQMPAVMTGKRQIHPHLYDRMLAAGITPDYPRPAPPNLTTAQLAMGFYYVVMFVLLVTYFSNY